MSGKGATLHERSEKALRLVSERKRAERALLLRRFAVDTAMEAIFTIDTSGRVVDVNKTACERLEYSREELIGLSTASFDVRFRQDQWPDHVEAIKRRGSLLIESEHRTRSGRVFPVEISIAYFEFEGDEYLCTFVRDITERKQVEAEQILFRKTLEEKNAALQDQNEELEEFAYSLSHDLKSPLVTAKNFLGGIERDLAAGNVERARGDLKRVHSAVDLMTSLLKEILKFSHLGSALGETSEISLDDLARQALMALSGEVAARGVEVKIQDRLPVVVGNSTQLYRVVQNLIGNAVKFMGDQPRPMIEIGRRDGQDEVVIFFQDNGIGIEPRHQKKVFGLFDRLDSGVDGTGIGLALVKKIVRLHRGRVWVESAGKGQGTTVCITLPRT